MAVIWQKKINDSDKDTDRKTSVSLNIKREIFY